MLAAAVRVYVEQSTGCQFDDAWITYRYDKKLGRRKRLCLHQRRRRRRLDSAPPRVSLAVTVTPKTAEEAIALQRQALHRQRSVMVLAGIGILACIAAIGYLVIRYF